MSSADQGISNRLYFGAVLMCLGFVVLLGPVTILLLIGVVTNSGSSNEFQTWFYISSLGAIIYIPVAIALIVSGIFVRRRARRDKEKLGRVHA